MVNFRSNWPHSEKKAASVLWIGDVEGKKCLSALHTPFRQVDHDPLLHAFLWIHDLHASFRFLFYDFLDPYFVFVFYAHLCFVCSLSLVGSTSCVCVLSFPVQCWSLSYGKQRRPYRLCVQTWLRQQVWRTFNFFSTGTHFVTALLFLLLLREIL